MNILIIVVFGVGAIEEGAQGVIQVLLQVLELDAAGIREFIVVGLVDGKVGAI